MRIEVIQRPPLSSIDGIRLDAFEPGKQYEVGNNIGAVFLAEGWAIPVALGPAAATAPCGDNEPRNPQALSGTDPHNLKRESNPPALGRSTPAGTWPTRRQDQPGPGTGAPRSSNRRPVTRRHLP